MLILDHQIVHSDVVKFPPNINGLASPPNGILINLMSSSLPFRGNKNLKASRSSGLIPICRNACLRLPTNRHGLILALIIMSHIFGCNAGPLYMQLLILFISGAGRALASKTMQHFVVLAFSLNTGLCGISNILEPDGSDGTFSMTPPLN